MKYLALLTTIFLIGCSEPTKEPEVKRYSNLVEQCQAQPELPWCDNAK